MLGIKTGKSRGPYNGEGRIIGDRGGAVPEEIGELYQHIGGARRNSKSELVGGKLTGRFRSVFNGNTRETLANNYLPGSIIVKRDDALSRMSRAAIGWPGEKSQISGRTLVRRNIAKTTTAAIALVWGGLSYETSPVSSVIPVTPSEAAASAAAAVIRIPDGIDRAFSSGQETGSTAPANTDVSTTPAPSETTATSSMPGTQPTPSTLPAFESGAEDSAGVPALPVTETTVSLTENSVLAPPVNPVESAVFRSGDMYCYETTLVTINDGEFAYNALARTTGEPLHDLPEGAANQLWNDIVAMNDGDIANEPGNSFSGPADCHNYDTISNGYQP